MVRHNINRLHPHTCDCIIELVTVYDDNNDRIPGEDEKFLLMNRVCDKHEHLKSTTHRENHHELSKIVVDYIEEAKRLNIEDWKATLARCRFEWERQDVERQLPGIERHNSRMTIEWNELLSPPHAFDQHIHEQIKKENG